MLKFVAVTGASRGIGKAISLHLQNNLNKINHDGIICIDKNWIEQDKTNFNDNVKLEKIDIGTSMGKNIIQFLNEKHGIFISTLINNASLKSIQKDNLSEMEIFNEIIEIDLKSTYALSKQFLESHKNSNSKLIEPRLISISSCVASHPSRDSMAYHMSKASLEIMCKKFLIEYGNIGLRSNCIAPGFIVKDEDLLRFGNDENQSYREIASKLHPNGKVGNVQDIVGVIEFLMSKESSFVNGQIIKIDGGYNIEDDFNLVNRIING